MITDNKLIDEFIEVDGVKTHVMRKGQGKPLVWLHGAGGIDHWLPIMEALSTQFDVIVPEHPGFGRSQRPNWMRDVEDLVYHYRSLFDQLGIEKALIVGHSFGGWVAMEFAINSPHRVEKLVLTAPAGLIDHRLERVDTFLLTQEQMAEKLFYSAELTQAALEKAKLPEEQELFIKNRAAYARFAWERPYNPKFERLLSKITVQTLIVWGEQDQIISPAFADRFAELIPNSEVKMISECGHLPHIEKKEEYERIVMDFLKN